ncbi:MAG: phage tail tape measure protein [Candidatus Dehalobacter alkaniphilus]
MAKNKVVQAVVDIAGSIDPSLGKAIQGATDKIGGLNIKALAAGAAVGGIAVATGKAVIDAGKYLKDLGAAFDGATDAIRIGTGATGDALDGLTKDFDAVYASVPTSMEDASKAIADFNTRLGLTGPELQDMSKQALQVSDMLGEDLNGVIENSSKALQQWNVDSADMGGGMDYIFKVSQSTGMGFTDLMTDMQKFGPQLQDMGYSFESAAALMGQMEKAGVNTDEVLGAMKKSVTTLAKEGVSASDGIAMYYEQIKNAGTAAEATAIASEVFGARAGSTMASAIRDGTLAVGDLTASLMENGETIAGAADDTYDFGERLQVMKQGLEVALKPMANTVFDGLNKFMPVLQKLMEKIVPVISDAVDAAMPFVEQFLDGAASALEEVLPLIADLAADLFPILTQLMSQLLPPILELAKSLLPPLMQIVQAILPPIASLLATILPMVVQIANMVLPVLAEMIAALMPLITPLLNVLLQVVQDVIMPLMPAMMQLVQALLPPVLSILGALAPILQPILGLLKPIADVLATIVGWIAKVVGWVADGLSWVVGLFTGDAKAPEGYATGGFTSGPSIAGEDPRFPTEAVISFNPAYRSQNLDYWAQAGQMLGASDSGSSGLLSGGGGTSVVYDLSGLSFSPKIEVKGNVDDEDTLIKRLKDLEPEFVDFVLEALAKREGGAYVTADSRVY